MLHRYYHRHRHCCPLAAALIAAVMLASISVSTSSSPLSSSTATPATSTASNFIHNAHALAQEESRRIAEEEHMEATEQSSLFDAPVKAEIDIETEMDWAGAAAALEERALDFIKGDRSALEASLMTGSSLSSGQLARLSRVWDRLVRGENITILAIGSSVTGNHGGCTEAAMPALEDTCRKKEDEEGTAVCCGGAGVRHEKDDPGWLRYVSDALQEAVDQHTSAESGSTFRLLNIGRAGASMSSYVTCFRNWVIAPEEVDIFILEMAPMASSESTKKSDSESIIRNILELAHSPLLLFASFEPLCLYRKCCLSGLHSLSALEIEKVCGEAAKTSKKAKRLFGSSRVSINVYCDPVPSMLDFDIPSWDKVKGGDPVVTDKFGNQIKESAARIATSDYIAGFLASYYDTPWISLHPLIEHAVQVGTFQWTDMYCLQEEGSKCGSGKSFACDPVHPRSQLARHVYASPLIYWFAKAFQSQVRGAQAPLSIGYDHHTSGLSSAQSSAPWLPPLPPVSEFAGERIYSLQCAAFVNSSAQIPELIKSKFPYLNETQLRITLRGGAELDEARVLRAPGWSYVTFPEQGAGSLSGSMLQARIKAGLLTHQVNAVAEVLVSTTLPSVLPPSEYRSVVRITYLVSYEHMGTALVECASGCTCASLEIQAHTSTHHSIEEAAAIYPSEADQCVIRITNINKTLSGENKFKLIFMTVVAEPGRK